MKKIDYYEIAQASVKFAMGMLNGIPDNIKDESFVIQSHLDNQIIINLILGALTNYHDQIRSNLLEQGIDIGDIDC